MTPEIREKFVQTDKLPNIMPTQIILARELKVLPDVRSPVAVVIYTDTHTYKQKVLLHSTVMFNRVNCIV